MYVCHAGTKKTNLGHVKDLNVVADGLATNDHVVLVSTNLTPDGRRRVLRQATKVDELSLGSDLGEGSTVALANSDELAAIRRLPTPRGRTLATIAAKVGMAQEVDEVKL